MPPSKAPGIVLKTLSESGPPPKSTSHGGASASAPAETTLAEATSQMEIDDPVTDAVHEACTFAQEALRQLFPLPSATVVDAPQGAVYNALGEVWYAFEGYADSISIPEDELRLVHETVSQELN